MARIRYIKPDFTMDADLAEVSLASRYLYLNLWCHMDCTGVCDANPRVIKAQIFPYDDEVTAPRVSALLSELVEHGFLFRVEFEGKHFLYCPTLVRHQKIHPQEKAKHPIPPEVLEAAATHQPEKNPASNPLATHQPEIFPTDLPLTLIDNGNRNGDGDGRGVAEQLLNPASPITQEPDLAAWLAEGDAKDTVPPPIQQTWISVWGPDKVWIEAELKKAMANWKANGNKAKDGAPKPLYCNRWLGREKDNLKKHPPAVGPQAAPKKPKIVYGDHRVTEDGRIILNPIEVS